MRRAFQIAAAVLLLTASGAHAEGENRRFSIHPSIRTLAVASDNLYLEKGNTDKGGGFWIQPNLEMDYRGRIFELGADLGADLRRYPGESQLNEEFWRASGFVEVGLLAR